MRLTSRFRRFQIAAAFVTLMWTGCATTTGFKPFDLATHRDQPATNQATPTQLAGVERANATSAGGAPVQFASTSTARPQQRYSAPSCPTGSG